MTLQVMLVVLGSALLHALWNAMVRSAGDKFSSTVWIVTGAALWSLPLLVWVAPPAAPSLPYLLASVLIHGVYFTLVALSYRGSELGVVYPLMRGSAPAFTALLGVAWLGESLSALAAGGVTLVCVGVWATAWGAWRAQANAGLPLQRSSWMLALLNAGVIAIYTLVDGAGVRLAGEALSYTLYLFVGTALMMGLLQLARMRWLQPRLQAAPTQPRATAWRLAAWGGAGTLGAYGLVLWAFAQAPVAQVAALRESSIVFALLIGAVFLKERLTPIKWLAAGLIGAGAVLLKLG